MSKKTFDRDLGVKTLVQKKGSCKVRLNVKQKHLNYGGIVHGGVIASICDDLLAGAILKSMSKSERCVTVQLNVEFMEPAYLGETIIGHSKLIRRGKTLAFVEGYLEIGKRKIAKAHGIWFIKKKGYKEG